MRSIRLRVLLPIIFGFFSLALFAWDYENERVVASMGMGWDMGPPVWPYEAVPLISFAVNGPAYIISWPVLKLLDLHNNFLQYAIWFPAIVLLWWWTGTCIDFGLLTHGSYNHRKPIAAILLASGIVLLILATHVGFDEYRLFQQYWPGHSAIYGIILLRAIGPILWCIFLARASVHSAIRLIRFEPPPIVPNPIGYRTYFLCAAILCLNAAGISYLDRAINPPTDPNYCETDRLTRSGCVHGTLTDTNEKPVTNVEVNLISTFKTGDARRFGTKSEWTDKRGRYNFNRIGSGEYILAVNPFGSSPGPAKECPFETRYYREADDESSAERVRVIQSSATNLLAVRLRKAKFTTIEVSVEWEDGSRPKRSDIFVQNTRYWGLLGGFE